MAGDKFEHVNRLREKIRQEDSETATYALEVFTQVLNVRAAKRRRRSPLRELVDEYVDMHKAPTLSGLLGWLSGLEKQGVIERVTEEEVAWVDRSGRARSEDVKNLGRMLRRARERR